MNDAANGVPEIRHVALSPAGERMMALQTAANLIGQPRLADGMGVADRTLRSYLAVERRLRPSLLLGAASALERRAAEFLAHAEKLRALAPPRGGSHV